MAQRKSERLVALVEPLVYTAAFEYVERSDEYNSISEYVRKLIIDDMRAKQVFTDTMLEKIAV